eukprot:CAMPEP_0198245886 /NCGR_PEP_ID=MMETSP1446-20131203/43362_1 /TAXON_ID=1461542 ORGANISM="Unidentified sp, Strain CCMP2111" /NCGR_SAMPLE_ID=MMETSP1446 /ASSEMBLY_ACC=CAM_ASM_001112 /LENGTH=138 /DNA_ID=CAMNT_0043930129 /DNA_START=156 /DNA_END=569 /DNA_ORIENTATION=+
MLESVIERKLQDEIPEFTLPWFVSLLSQYENENPFEGDVFDMLLSLTEFSEFKEMMISYKREKDSGRANGVSGVDEESLPGDFFEVKRMRIFSEVSTTRLHHHRQGLSHTCSQSLSLPRFCRLTGSLQDQEDGEERPD